MTKLTNEHGLASKQWVQLSSLRERPDGVDIHIASKETWAVAAQARFYRPRKRTLGVKLDRDVLNWVRGQDPSRQTTISRILRESVEAASIKT